MPIGTVYKLDKTILASGQELHAIASSDIQHGIKTMTERSAGEVWPSFLANEGQKPMVAITTKQLDILLANVPIQGASLSNVTAYLKQAAVTGSASRLSTVHEKCVITSCCVYWTDITLRHQGQGEAKVIIAAVYDGTHDPFLFTGSIALPTSLAASSYFGAGPVEINGSLVPGTQEITIESGIKLLQLGDASEEFDTFVGIETGDPSITVKTLQEVNWLTLGLRGLTLDGTNGMVCFGRKYAQGGSRVANATAQHLKFSGLNGQAIPIDKNGQNSSPCTDTLKVIFSDPNSAVPMTISTTSSIV